MGIRHPKPIFIFRGQTTSFRVSVPAVVCCFTTPPTSSDSNRQTPMPKNPSRRLQQACTRRVYRWGLLRLLVEQNPALSLAEMYDIQQKSWDNLTVTVSIIQTAEKPLKSWDICEASSSNWCETPIKNGISIIHDLILHQRVYQKHP